MIFTSKGIKFMNESYNPNNNSILAPDSGLVKKTGLASFVRTNAQV